MTDRDHKLNFVLHAGSIACLVMAMFVALSGTAATRAALIGETDRTPHGATASTKAVFGARPSNDSENVARGRRSSAPR